MTTSGTAQAQAAQRGIRWVDEVALDAKRFDFTRIGMADAHRRKVIPLREDDGGFVFVLSDASDSLLMAWLASKAGGAFRWALADRAAIKRALAAMEPSNNKGSEAASSLPKARRMKNGQSPVVDFVDRVVEDAWNAGASDIHWETRRDGLCIKYRLDGVLVEAGRWTGSEPASEVLSRIKVLAELDIAERRVPQDGRFTRTLGDRPVDFRVSVMPNSFGEDAVLRILDKRHLLHDAQQISVDRLGFTGDKLKRIRSLATRPHGMMLMTGPTGSGKTTTLYAAISETLNGREKVITIEDPIEYELPGVLQIPVNEKKGLTFARGLRSILRHDPDTIFVGEIRDAETADIAVQSALTGHLVFTTVHANDLFDVIGRFIHMQVDLYSLMSALNGVVSQRLVRLLCSECAVPDADAEGVLAQSGFGMPVSGGRWRQPTGCERCRGTGYAGRTVISEVVFIDDRLRELVISRSAVLDMKRYVAEVSSSPMRSDALDLLTQGLTSYEEVSRVLAPQ